MKNVLSTCVVLIFALNAEAQFKLNRKCVLTAYEGTPPEEMLIPDTINGRPVKSIKTGIFRGVPLTSVVIPSSVTRIEGGAFSSGRNIASVVIPNGVRHIGEWAFFYNQLTTVNIPDSITSLGVGAFGMNRLRSVKIPSRITRIPLAAFEHNQLISIDIPKNIQHIGAWSFVHNRLTSLTIPGSVKSIGAWAFHENDLTSVNIAGSVESIGERAFDKNLIEAFHFEKNPHLTKVRLPSHKAYKTVGWTYNGTPVKVSADGRYYAEKFDGTYKFIKGAERTYVIHYEVNGGDALESTYYTLGSQTITLPIPTFFGHAFKGWYKTKNLTGDAVVEIPHGSSYNQTLWAKWDKDKEKNATGIDEGQLLVYPNPVSDKLYVDFQGLKAEGVQILDAEGNVLHSANASGKDKLLINVSDYNKALYVIRVMLQDGRLIMQKVVKK